MGYTHYFPPQREFTDKEWNKMLEAFGKILGHYPGVVQLEENDSRPPQADAERIQFNGIGSDGHETFLLTKKPLGAFGGFSSCKTARKPYDLVVCLTLLAAHVFARGALSISSDGDWNDKGWCYGSHKFAVLFPEEAAPENFLGGEDEENEDEEDEEDEEGMDEADKEALEAFLIRLSHQERQKRQKTA
jgi:hypothetical protein